MYSGDGQPYGAVSPAVNALAPVQTNPQPGSTWATRPFARESALLIVLAGATVLLLVLTLTMSWYAVVSDIDGEDYDGKYEERSTSHFKLGGIMIVSDRDEGGNETHTKFSMTYGSGDEEDQDDIKRIKNQMLVMKVLTIVNLIVALVLLALCIGSLVLLDRDTVGKAIMGLAIGVLALGLTAGMIFAILWPGALDDPSGDDKGKGTYDEWGGDKSFFGSGEVDDSDDEWDTRKGDINWRPSWAWFFTTIGLPILGGVMFWKAKELRLSQKGLTDDVSQPADDGWGAVPTTPAPQPTPQVPPQQAAPQQTSGATAAIQCPHCQFQLSVYSTGVPQTVQCVNCQNPLTVTV